MKANNCGVATITRGIWIQSLLLLQNDEEADDLNARTLKNARQKKEVIKGE